jgi:hypothetical protein
MSRRRLPAKTSYCGILWISKIVNVMIFEVVGVV